MLPHDGGERVVFHLAAHRSLSSLQRWPRRLFKLVVWRSKRVSRGHACLATGERLGVQSAAYDCLFGPKYLVCMTDLSLRSEATRRAYHPSTVDYSNGVEALA
jgi:hypothetical protein